MQQLNLPEYPFRTRNIEGRIEIFDEARRRYIALTAEEWVRQHFIMYLHAHLGYPLSLIAVEKSIQINRMTKRFDIAIYKSAGEAVMLVECKAPEIKLTQAVLDQAGRYNLKLNVPYLVVTNGIHHVCCYIDKKNNSWAIMDRIPLYKEL